MTAPRALSLGATPAQSGVRFELWAPGTADVTLVLDQDGRREVLATRRDGEYRLVTVEGASPGTRYGYLVDGAGPFPDPCSRSQPDGPHGLSEVVAPAAFPWSDQAWTAPRFEDLVVYEAHVGTFTRAGTFRSAIRELSRLRELGVTAIELMPVATFPGRRGWGYDGVAMFAPAATYGGPEGFREFVDAAHRTGLAVILDVVYNHFGPDGNYTGVYSRSYRTDRYRTPWGDAVNFDGPGSEHVRRFVIENLRHWVREYHIDGFRLDATHAIFDGSREHILAEVSRSLEGEGPSGRRPYLVAESHENDVRYLRLPAHGGYGFDAVWADDFHHAIRTLIAGDRDGYYRGYDGSANTLARTVSQGFYFEGQHDPGVGHERGTRAREVPWTSFVYCIQNHDQVGNRAFGERLSDDAARGDFLAATMLLLLLPQVPLLFQGQEFAASTPFLYFTDHEPGLGRLVTAGRRQEFAAFSAFADAALRRRIPDPQAASTFRRSQLRQDEARVGRGVLVADFHRTVIGLRNEDAVLRSYRESRLPLQVVADGRTVIVVFEAGDERRCLVANFGEERELRPPEGDWSWSITSDEARFGGLGRSLRGFPDGRLTVPGHTAGFGLEARLAR